MLLNQPIRLPFPYDTVIQGNYISDPNSYSFPTPPCGPEAAAHLQFIAANLCTLLQAYVNQGPISLFAYNLFSNNHFNNDAWIAIVSDTYDFATKLAQCNPGSDIGQILTTAVQRYYQYAVANCMNRYPELQQVVPLDAVNRAIQAVNGYRATVQQLDVQLQRTMTQQSSQLVGLATPRVGAGGVNLVGGGFDNLAVNIVQGEENEAGGWGRRRRLSAALAEELGVKELEKPSAPTQITDMLPWETAPSAVTAVDENMAKQTLTAPRRLPPAPRERQGEQVAAVEQPEEIVEVVERPQFKVRETPREEPVYNSNPQICVRHMVVPENLEELPDEMEDLTEHAGEFRLSELTGIEGNDEFGIWLSDEGELVKVVSPTHPGWTMSALQLTRTPYNPKKWHRALVQQCTADNDLIGPVLEGFIRVKEHDPMDYLDLELDPAVRAKVLADMQYNKTYVPVKGEVYEISSVNTAFGYSGSNKEDPVKADERQVALYALNRTQRRAPVLACIELAAVMSGRDEAFLGGATGGETGVRMRLLDAAKYLPSKPICAHPKWVDVDNMLDELHDNLLPLGKQVDQMLTAEVNQLLMYGFGLQSLEIESFYGDYEELLEAIKASHSEEAAEKFNDSVRALFTSLFWSADQNNLHILQETVSYHLHGAIDDYGVHLVSKDLGLAKVSKCPMLTRVLSEALDKFGFRVDTHPIYIGFSDGMIWRVIPSIWDENHLTFVAQN